MLLLPTMEQAIHGPASDESVERRIARLAASRHGVFSRSQAVGAGATRGLIEWRVATSRWEVLHPGVYRLAGAPESWRQRLLAGCLVAGKGTVVSHRAAGALRQLPGAPEGIIELSVPAGRRVRRAGILVHETKWLAPVDITVVDAIPVTTATRTLIDLAGVVSVEVLEEALDDALRRRLTSLPRLRWRLAELARAGRPGVIPLRALLAARGGASTVPESVLETRLLRVLRRAGLPIPACQYPVRDRGRIVAVVDFAYPDICLAIEVDGYRWHSGRARWERDLGRRNVLTGLGWRVIHVTSTDLQRRPDEMIGTITGALARG